MKNVTNAELLARCQQRDPRAWHEVVNRFQRLMVSIGLKNGLSLEDAEDVAQTTFLVFYDSLHTIQDGDRLSAWLSTVARRQSWKIRNQSRRDLPLETEDESPSDDPIDRWETESLVGGALASLDSRSRELIWMLFLDPSEPHYEEVARLTNRRVGGIGPARARALQKLRLRLADAV